MNVALLLSGGTGTRLGGTVPKQYMEVNGRPIISYSLERLSKSREIDRIHIVAEPSWREPIQGWLATYEREKKYAGTSLPGENRQLSILSGLRDIRRYAEDTDYVLVHDAARPLLSERQIADCLRAAQGHDGALPVLPMKDTVYLSESGKTVSGLLDRGHVYAGQAPEAFRLGTYYEANLRLLPDRILEIRGASEPAVLAGLDIVMIPGDEENFKITTRADLERFRRMTREGGETE